MGNLDYQIIKDYDAVKTELETLKGQSSANPLQIWEYKNLDNDGGTKTIEFKLLRYENGQAAGRWLGKGADILFH